MATVTIEILTPNNSGSVIVVNVDSEDVACSPNESVRFRYCPPQLSENDPAIARIIETGPPDNKEKQAVDIRPA